MTKANTRKWAFEKAMLLKDSTDIVSDIIYKASEIEAYISQGKNPRPEFIACVEAAIADAEYISIPNVGDDKKRKVIEVVRKELKEYCAL